MNREDCYILGKVTKAQGYRGKVICFLDTDLPERYSKLESVLLEDGHELVPFFIEQISVEDKGKAIVKFSDVDTEEAALAIVNQNLWLPLSSLPDLGPNKFYFHEVPGFKVIDKETQQHLGEVKEVLEYPRNELLQVMQGETEILIPIRDPFIFKVDKGNKEITVDLPQGYLDAFL